MNRDADPKPRKILVALTACFAVSHLDRQILSIMLGDIGREFSLSDIQLGVLSGVAFALFYAAMSIPFGLLASRMSRRNILAVSMIMWSSLTFVSGFVTSFAQLLLARLGVGFSEAAVVPTAHSIISDLYAPERRTSALAVFMSGASLGTAVALVAGGIITQVWGWRVCLMVAGVPGVLLSVYMLVSFPALKIPNTDGAARQNAWGDIVRTIGAIRRNPALIFMVCGTVFSSVSVFAGAAWVPVFLVRVHGLNLAEVGLYLAAVVGFGGVGATIASGLLTDFLARRAFVWIALFPAIIVALAKLMAVIGFSQDGVLAALVFLAVSGVAGAIHHAPTTSFMHQVLPVNFRPVGSSLLLVAVNLIGMGTGPLFVGVVSTMLGETDGALKIALASVQGIGLLGAVFFFCAAAVLSGRGHVRSGDA